MSLRPHDRMDLEPATDRALRDARRDDLVARAMVGRARLRLAETAEPKSCPVRARILLCAVLAGGAFAGLALAGVLEPLGPGRSWVVAVVGATAAILSALGGRPWPFLLGTVAGFAALGLELSGDAVRSEVLEASVLCAATVVAWGAATLRDRSLREEALKREERDRAERVLSTLTSLE